ncbi:acyloxyacyl hydrolase [Rhodohalobacter mucosus]|uniref:Lipid A 3-O-deacylase (PagL) n=1 Tax=Rhodohalobacter mucosus TaxID=2079485 RepID=A0A316U1Z8_9BACT|nr:acyloxyacyl hydrolase [Rhodohalobacter mucosus]PWN07096.1 hypothetical protein DDZ15_07480 [Rhodohalobacter mucosus]
MILKCAVHFCCLIIITFLFSVKTSAQTQEGQSSPEELFRPAFGITGNYSPNSFKAWGKVRNTRQSQIMLSYQHTKVTLGKVPVRISTDLIVSSWIRYPIDGANGPRENVFGLGLIPANFDIPLSKKTSGLFLTASAGFLVFDRVFPTVTGTRFNYMLAAGIGYRYQAGENMALQGGYKLKHLSNGNTGETNPGIDSQNIFVGILFTL